MKTHDPSRRGRRALPRLSWLTAVMLGAGLVPALAQVLPSGFATPSGGVSASTSGSTMTITQSQQRGIAHWNDFSIGAGGTVNVVQPNANSVLLNRVITDTTSQIDGALNANGHVYLINPWGVLFGAGARVNVGGIVASTLDLTGTTVAERNDRFMRGGALEFAVSEGGASGVWVDPGAEIRTQGNGGLVALLGEQVTNGGLISAPGGTVALGVGDRITLDPVGDGLTTLRIDLPSSSDAAGIFNEAGGRIEADGGRVLLKADSLYGAVINQQGVIQARRLANRGGEITLEASADNQTEPVADVYLGGTLDADGVGSASGGRIQVNAAGALVLDGRLTARGGSGGAADGGAIETSGGSFSIGSGFAVDASATAPGGQAGTWLLDPQDLTITPGPAAGATNTLYDSTISAALDTGTNVTVVTPAGGTSTGGDVVFNDVNAPILIQRTAAGAPVGFTINADRSITSASALTGSPGAGITIESSAGAGPLNVHLNADAHNHAADPATGGGRIALQGLTARSNGGDIGMKANWTDGAGGWAIDLGDTVLESASGSIALAGFSSTGGGVQLSNSTVTAGGTGAVSVTGVGNNSQLDPGNGVALRGSSIETQAGSVAVHGHVQDGLAVAPEAGVLLDSDSWIESQSGSVDVVGSAASSNGGSTGLQIDGRVATGGDASLRAFNDGNADALVVGTSGSVQAGGMLNLRPGGFDGSAWTDRPGDAIELGAASGTGFALSPDELARLSAGTAVVVGSDVHAGPITVDGAIAVPYALTLQNGAGGGIQLDAPVQAPRLALDSGGSIRQHAGAHIEADELLARSRGGDVDLQYVENDAGALAGSAAGDFAYVDANALSVRPLSLMGASSAVNAPQPIQVSSLQGGLVRVQTLSDDLTLAMPASSSAGTDLVAAARFQNPGAGSISGAPWRVWADTWEGETRGGMAGSGPLPNLYGCTYEGSCGVSVSTTDNHFIYTQRPTATVTINDVTRPVGLPNPPFGMTVSGLRPGDSAAAIHGSPSTDATAASPIGSYEINGDYTSDAGYQLEVVPGTLKVVGGGLPGDTPGLDLPGDTPTYDGNLGGAPICLASAPLDGDRADVEGDVLAREWSRVRVRPRLTSCIDSSRRNACSDF
ncbi:MAG TPA: filamentous hemagglutinin N-terminal domain-containing protein [Ottowia sp.]|uniref:two-partner secretion domain-containing protein n=1 Tax=Ottowia sp. TaxID=1898956 RepID=UPI002B9C858B|nr:filamentous hemagglutinin N-terminal domain-containing protein [Ottowia sp.]HMN20118.1 filamentous hemagglutinin N-terminal domain-containing protein [Ottowia sp.]